MEITINVEDYVSQETIKEICEDAIKNCAREWARNEIAARKNITTLFANAAYKETARMLAKTEPDFEEKIREKVRDVIEAVAEKWSKQYQTILILGDKMIKVNRIYWECHMSSTRTPDTDWIPKIAYHKVQVVTVDTKMEEIDFIDEENLGRKFCCTVDNFISTFGKTKKEAFEKELNKQKEKLRRLKMRVEYFEKEGYKDEL